MYQLKFLSITVFKQLNTSSHCAMLTLFHPRLQVLNHVSVFSPAEPPCSSRLLQGVVWCPSTARSHQISQCSWGGHKKIWWRTTVGGTRLPAIFQGTDWTFLPGKASVKEPISRGCPAERIPEETPASGGEEGTFNLITLNRNNPRKLYVCNHL